MSLVHIKLSWAEVQVGVWVGCQRHIRALAKGRQHRWDKGEAGADDWGHHIGSALSEQALAKHLNIYWSDSPNPDYNGDVGPYFVRWTERPNGCLLLHPEDMDERVHVLVVGIAPVLTLVGWLNAEDGKRNEWWRTFTGRPCYFVPQEALHPISDLELAAAA